MPLNLDLECQFNGPALPEPYVKFELESELRKQGLLPVETGDAGKKLQEQWELLRTKLRNLVSHGGAIRVRNHVIDPLIPILGYTTVEDGGEVSTDEEMEDGGLVVRNGAPDIKLRAWAADLNADLDAPEKRGLAARFSPAQKVERVLRASGERLGLLTNGSELRLVISDPGRVSSSVNITLEPHWKRRELPDSLRLLIALTCPKGVKALPAVVEKARLQQARVTKELRRQAREAIEGFVQAVLDEPKNKEWFKAYPNKEKLAKELWHEGLILIYRLLFILKLEATDDAARTFCFASSALWRQTFSPSAALAPIARKVLDGQLRDGELLEQGLRSVFRLLSEGMEATELKVTPVGGALFGPESTPILSKAHWGEHAVARLLDKLLWTSPKGPRQRVHYGPLDVEDLGRVYEALLELEPGITTETMCRLRRSKLEVVVPAAQGEKYRPKQTVAATETDETEEEEPEEEEQEEKKGKKTAVLWIEEIKPGKFYLRVGLGRKATGSFYTPHSFVRFLVLKVLGALVARVSPLNNPNPCAILLLKVIDKAMGSGHFLVEACRFLGEKLYEAARRCDELALQLEKEAENQKLSPEEKQKLLAKAAEYRQRVIDLPDPDDEMVKYLPSRAPEKAASGYSMSRALALSRRMVAVHCIYGVDRNRLAVELAKLALWIECHAEGLPLTFLDHRLVVGDSLTGPFFEHLLKYPGTQQRMDDLFTRGLTDQLAAKLAKALEHVKELERSVGVTLGEVQAKEAAKARLDAELAPFKTLAAAWAGGVMLGSDEGGCDDTAYAELAKAIANTGELPAELPGDTERLCAMVSKGLGLAEAKTTWAEVRRAALNLPSEAIPPLAFELTYPEVFYGSRRGFDAALGNPPWDQMEIAEDEFWAFYNIEAIASRDHRERAAIVEQLRNTEHLADKWNAYTKEVEAATRLSGKLYAYQSAAIGTAQTTGRPDLWRLFAERSFRTTNGGGKIGMVFPSAFHGNEGATGIRRLYLDELDLEYCYSFENRRLLFDIHRSFKFAVVGAGKPGPTKEFTCAFYKQQDNWLFTHDEGDEGPITVSLNEAKRLFGKHLVFVEARTKREFGLVKAIRNNSARAWADHILAQRISVSNGIECHRRADITFEAPKGASLKKWNDQEWEADPEYILLPDGKNVHQFTIFSPYDIADRAKTTGIIKSAHWRSSLPHYRVALRYVASSTNERTVIATILPPMVGFANGLVGETAPSERPNVAALEAAGLLNSFTFDYQVRQQATTHVNRYVLAGIGVPDLKEWRNVLAHGALRLSSNTDGYRKLWKEQLGEEWREPKPRHHWPVLEGDDERWAVRAAIDAVVAQAYGLSREQYAHVLSTFSHASYKKAPELCLARFDELQKIGLEAFCKKHDPYWDVPLNENLPKPVIDLPIPEEAGKGPGQMGFAGIMDASNGQKPGRKRNK